MTIITERHKDSTSIEKAIKWCLDESIGTGSSRILAKLLLNKYNHNSYPVCEVHGIMHNLDETRRKWAFDIIMYYEDNISDTETIERLSKMYLPPTAEEVAKINQKLQDNNDRLYEACEFVHYKLTELKEDGKVVGEINSCLEELDIALKNSR